MLCREKLQQQTESCGSPGWGAQQAARGVCGGSGSGFKLLLCARLQLITIISPSNFKFHLTQFKLPCRPLERNKAGGCGPRALRGSKLGGCLSTAGSPRGTFMNLSSLHPQRLLKRLISTAAMKQRCQGLGAGPRWAQLIVVLSPTREHLHGSTSSCYRFSYEIGMCKTKENSPCPKCCVSQAAPPLGTGCRGLLLTESPLHEEVQSSATLVKAQNIVIFAPVEVYTQQHAQCSPKPVHKINPTDNKCHK